MTSINKELEAAKAAKAVISTLSERPSLAPLHHAIAVLHLSNQGPLDEARKDAGIALSVLVLANRRQRRLTRLRARLRSG